MAGAAMSRRGFLRLGGFSAAMMALAAMRPGRGAAVEEVGLRVLSAREAAIFSAVAARMTDTGDAGMPPFAATGALQTVDAALRHLDEDVRRQLGIALRLFEYGPMLFELRLSRFTALAPAEQDESIAGWRDSRFETRRLAYRALKNLSFLGYYTQDETWKGIHYLGPVLPRPRRPVPA